MLAQTKQQITVEAEKLEQTIWDMALFLHDNPELGLEEYKSAAYLTELLEAHGFAVERSVAGLETAFRATYQVGPQASPAVAYLAEYDALPDIGHACGHNLIGAAGVGAGIVLSKIKSLPGRIVVLGTPAEESAGGKIPMVKQGLLAGIDAAMMVHPGDRHERREKNLAVIPVKVEFRGKPAHAAAEPFEGVNALDAMIALFNNIGLLRQQLNDDVRIHGFISHGGTASNIIPEYTRAEFLVRASQLERTFEVLEKFKNCVKAAAVATGAAETIHVNMEHMYEPLMTNGVIMDLYEQNMRQLGVELEPQDPASYGGSSDIGNVSQAVLAIHPTLGIAEPGQVLVGHHPDFTAAAKSKLARVALGFGVQALAMCGADLLLQPEVIAAVRAEFEKDAASDRGKS